LGRSCREPHPWAGILFSTVLAPGLIWYVTSDPMSNVVANLSGTTAFLLLCVFTVVIVAGLVLRRKRDPNARCSSPRPGNCPARLIAVCFPRWAVGGPQRHPVPDRRGTMAIGVVLWFITRLINRRTNGAEGEQVGTQSIGKDDA
jgi:APA family basic amino acid/polyamine antiporter